ncbi:50S ribosomal L1 [Olea europaea subsp. europaea]|uniref:50S ribosomal L1 n=1 Tax=Olea europaea subsp. europaea TaxID=158383 RepID=A0A8S0TNF8_OLEEU|nr:50S ribosomal L1 [Olea europaea subsp. europaea]
MRKPRRGPVMKCGTSRMCPVISLVSYPSRVAPLHEDRVKVEEDGSKNESDALERERRRIDDEKWNVMMARRRVLGEEHEEDNVAFLILINVNNDDKNSKEKRKVIYDLKEVVWSIKTYRVAVFAERPAADEAQDAGADIIGGPELVENIRSGDLLLSLL